MACLIVIGTSTGGLEALKQLTAALPANLPATILIVMHIGAHRSILPELLARHCQLPVRHAQNGETLAEGVILVAPHDHHLLVVNDNGVARVALSHGPKENHARPAIDPLFRSAAEFAGPDVIGVVLTGHLDDGSVGLMAVKACGGIAVVQDPASATAPDMPANALRQVAADYCAQLDQIGPLLVQLAHGNLAGTATRELAPEWIRAENSFARSMGNILLLEKIGVPSTYTCPDCHGALWHVNAAPAHFRCHTGHSYTIRTLLALQDQMVEQALWAGARALQEKASLAQQLAEENSTASPSQQEYLTMAAHAQQTAERVKVLLNDSLGEVPAA